MLYDDCALDFLDSLIIRHVNIGNNVIAEKKYLVYFS